MYRVHPLPESMLPLVWDFGQLSDETETLYAAQIVHRYVCLFLQLFYRGTVSNELNTIPI